MELLYQILKHITLFILLINMTKGKLLLFLIITSSLLLVQCYSQYEYLTKDYDFNSVDKLVSLTMLDSTKKHYKNGGYKMSVLNDSLLLVYRSDFLGGENIAMYSSRPDTIKLKNISSLKVIDYDNTSSMLLILGGGLGLIIVAIIEVLGRSYTVGS